MIVKQGFADLESLAFLFIKSNNIHILFKGSLSGFLMILQCFHLNITSMQSSSQCCFPSWVTFQQIVSPIKEFMNKMVSSIKSCLQPKIVFYQQLFFISNFYLHCTGCVPMSSFLHTQHYFAATREIVIYYYLVLLSFNLGFFLGGTPLTTTTTYNNNKIIYIH